MMTLISLAISVAFVFSVAVTLGYPGEALWWELATLVTIMLLGHWIEMRSISQAQGALRELASSSPDTAQRLVGERIEEVPVSALAKGDLVLVRPGASIPADGIVRSGNERRQRVDDHRRISPGGEERRRKVIAGTVNGAGSLRVEVTGTGDRRRSPASCGSSSRRRHRARARRRWPTARRSCSRSSPSSPAAVTLVTGSLAGAPAAFAVERVVTVLVIACPHALGLAIPLVVAISTTLGARIGSARARPPGTRGGAATSPRCVFDKTGTLTRGEFRVVDIATDDGHERRTRRSRLPPAVERDSEHTIAQGIVKSAEEQRLTVPKADTFEAIPGMVYGRSWRRPEFSWVARRCCAGSHVRRPARSRRGHRAARRAARRALPARRPTRALAVFAVADAVRANREKPSSGCTIRASRWSC